MSKIAIGIDIGGTHTDAVMVACQTEQLLDSVKVSTTQQIENGFDQALSKLMESRHFSLEQLEGLFVGSTHCLNAVLEAKNLLRVGVLRIGGNKPLSPAPGFGWPITLSQQVISGYACINGGFECNGNPITPFSDLEAKAALQRLLDQGAQAIAIVSVFAPLNGTHEERSAEILNDLTGQTIPYTLSHHIGSVGILERESATILYCAFNNWLSSGFSALTEILKRKKIETPLWLTQNNGSLLTLEEALEFPIRTLAAGATNSFMGGAKLAGCSHAIVIDIGGTSTDIGVIENGFARRSTQAAMIGGVRLNFPMPDTCSLPIGGGSVIENISGKHQLSAQSCGKDLKKFAQVFGGKHLTLTDAAVLLDKLRVPEACPKDIQLSRKCAEEILEATLGRIEYAIQKMKGVHKELPVFIVGGGAAILDELFSHRYGIKGSIPHHAHVANAFGAALAEVSFTIDRVCSLEKREAMLESIQAEAVAAAIKKGANPNKTRVAALSILPYSYSKQELARVTVTASGGRF